MASAKALVEKLLNVCDRPNATEKGLMVSGYEAIIMLVEMAVGILLQRTN